VTMIVNYNLIVKNRDVLLIKFKKKHQRDCWIIVNFHQNGNWRFQWNKRIV
jgi:hypothetical protein